MRWGQLNAVTNIKSLAWGPAPVISGSLCSYSAVGSILPVIPIVKRSSQKPSGDTCPFTGLWFSAYMPLGLWSLPCHSGVPFQPGTSHTLLPFQQNSLFSHPISPGRYFLLGTNKIMGELLRPKDLEGFQQLLVDPKGPLLGPGSRPNIQQSLQG